MLAIGNTFDDLFRVDECVNKIVDLLVVLGKKGIIDPSTAARVIKPLTDAQATWVEKNYTKEEISLFMSISSQIKQNT